MGKKLRGKNSTEYRDVLRPAIGRGHSRVSRRQAAWGRVVCVPSGIGGPLQSAHREAVPKEAWPQVPCTKCRHCNRRFFWRQPSWTAPWRRVSPEQSAGEDPCQLKSTLKEALVSNVTLANEQRGGLQGQPMASRQGTGWLLWECNARFAPLPSQSGARTVSRHPDAGPSHDERMPKTTSCRRSR